MAQLKLLIHWYMILWFCNIAWCVWWLLDTQMLVLIFIDITCPNPYPVSSWFCRSGHHSLWTSCRLLQRRRFHRVRLCMCSVNHSYWDATMQSWLSVSTHCCVSGLCCGWPHRSANKCLLKVAHMSAMLQQFNKAAEIFEEVKHLHLALYPASPSSWEPGYEAKLRWNHAQSRGRCYFPLGPRLDVIHWKILCSDTQPRITSSRHLSVGFVWE